MNEWQSIWITPFFAFFAVMSPLANAPVFLSLTAELSSAERKAIAWRGVLVALVTLAAFAVGGAIVLKMFGITINSVRAFGGLIVVRIGFELVTKSASSAHAPVGGTSSAGLGIAISPLGIPILAGPGALATALGLTAGGGWPQRLGVVAAFSLVALLNLLAFLTADSLVKWLGEELIGATTKVMGIILGAIGTQMAVSGIAALVVR